MLLEEIYDTTILFRYVKEQSYLCMSIPIAQGVYFSDSQ